MDDGGRTTTGDCPYDYGGGADDGGRTTTEGLSPRSGSRAGSTITVGARMTVVGQPRGVAPTFVDLNDLRSFRRTQKVRSVQLQRLPIV